MNKLKSFMQKPGVISLIASLISILVGLIFGFILLLVFDSVNASDGFRRLLTTGVSSLAKLAQVLYQSAPLIMTGLSVGFAFKTGLFNIGASGQYCVGACCALIAAIILKAPWWLCMIFAMMGGAIWGIFPGLFKALFNVNEVITSIMFNWIALFSVNLTISNIPPMLANFYGGSVANRTPPLSVIGKSAIIPKLGLDKLFSSDFMNTSILVSVFFALVIWIILDKTTFGYELKAVGSNRNASVYAGISDKRSIVLSMIIAGGLSGVAGGIYYLAGPAQFVIEKTLPAMGFNGIPVALLAMSNPLATVFSALFISFIQVGGDALQPEYVRETIDIIISVIIYISAFSLLMKDLIGRLFRIKNNSAAGDSGGASAADSEITGEGDSEQ